VHAGFGGRLSGKGPHMRDLAGQPTLLYEIRFDQASGIWSARYKTSFEPLTAQTCDELRQAIRIDYQERRLAEQRALARLQERSSI
jgi:hypothetical protein